jgi:hypothetical protein
MRAIKDDSSWAVWGAEAGTGTIVSTSLAVAMRMCGPLWVWLLRTCMHASRNISFVTGDV